MILVKDLKIGKFIINTEILDNQTYGVISNSMGVKNDFLLLLAGMIDNNKTILFENNSVFEHSEYFKKRVYFDFKRNYLKTLNTELIKSTLINRLNLEIDSDDFKKSVSNFNIRSEVLVTDEYKFTDNGVTLSNFCLLKSLKQKNNLIINNPTINIKKEEFKKQVISFITDKSQFNSSIIHVDDYQDYKGLIDRFIIFGDFENVFSIDANKDTFIITDDNVFIRNKIFKKGHLVMALNDYSKVELKSYKQKYKVVTFYDGLTLMK